MREIFEELEFRRIIGSLSSIFNLDEEKNKLESEKIEKEKNIDLNPGFGQFSLFENNISSNDNGKFKIVYQFIKSDVSADIFLKKLEKQNDVSYHITTEKLGDYDSALKSISFCWQNDVCYILKSDYKKFDKLIKLFFENDKISKISNDLKFDIKTLNKKNITVNGDIFDIKLAHYLINPDISHNLINLSKNYLNIFIRKCRK